MSQKIFQERLQRISQQGQSGTIIPGQVEAPAKADKRRLARAAAASKPQSVLTSILAGAIMGAIVGLAFQNVVGVQIFLGFDFKAEWLEMQGDMLRAAVWGAVALGLALMLLSWPKRRRWRKIASCSVAYTASAVGVNAQDLFLMVPGDVFTKIDDIVKAAGLAG